jgi:hypothetical protein
MYYCICLLCFVFIYAFGTLFVFKAIELFVRGNLDI